MRAIDADALMDNIKRDSKKAIDEGDKVGSFWLGYAAGSVIAQPTIQPEPQWISVSERLPAKSANYLVTVRWYREDDIDINVYEYNAWHKEWNDGESCGQRVIAWMPLPEPYKPNNK